MLADQAFAESRLDAAERARENAAAELLGRPKPTVHKLLHDAKAEREAREAVEEETPASVAEVGKLKKSLARLQ